MVVGEIATERELVIIGGGPGGYNAAIRAAQLGLEVTLIEKGNLGGVCLNEGCIPSKVFTHAAEKMSEVSHLQELGLGTESSLIDINQLQDYKTKTVAALTKGVQSLLKQNGVEVVEGTASFLSSDRIAVENKDRFEVYRFEKAIVAAGSRPLEEYNGIAFDGKRVFDPISIYKAATVPDTLTVYGCDYLALEAAFSYNAFGSKVSLILGDGRDDFSFDTSINRELKRLMKKAKIKCYTSCSVERIDADDEKTQVRLTNKKGEPETVVSEALMISAGVQPNLEMLGLDRAGVEFVESEYIPVDDVCRTNVETIYAVGDVTDGPALAVKAIKQGKAAAEACAGFNSEVDLAFTPIVVRTVPPVVSVGLTERDAEEQGFDVHVGQFPLGGNGFAAVIGKKDGFVKVISDKKTDRLLGFHAIGTGAAELVSMGTLALETVARDEDLTFPLYPHPSLNEAWMEAVEALKGKAVHAAPAK
ncbi:MAG TPA: dihydrolipoyl dehydrogenase [Bacillales bacterium]|nr:dihydrolipoyl dehydrogenase [Bacillales bacterium]